MSGANGIEKFLRVDREERSHPKTLSPRFYSRFPNPGAAPANEFINPITQAPDPTRMRYPLLSQTVPVGALDAQQALNDILLTSASSAAITGPSAASIAALLGQLYLTSLGNGQLGANANNEIDGYQIYIENNDTVAKTITFGAGVTPAALTVLPGTVVALNVEVTQNNPPLVRQYVLSTASITPTGGLAGFGTALTANQPLTGPGATTPVLFDSITGPNYAGNLYNPATGIWTVPVTGYYNISNFGNVIVAVNSGQVGILDIDTAVYIAKTDNIVISPVTGTQYALVRTGVFLTAGNRIQVNMIPNGVGTMTMTGSASPNFINGFSATLAFTP